jgi:glycine cleavage system H protein
MVPDDCLYTQEHEWLRREGTEAVVGVTEYASEQLGAVTYAELPEHGREVTRGKAMAVVESVKAVSDVYAPASGRIVAVNAALADAPELINEDPHGEGWLCRIELQDESELAGLMDAAAYEKHIEALKQ